MSSYTQRNNDKRLSGIEFYELLQKGEISSPSRSDMKNSAKMFGKNSMKRSVSLNQTLTNKSSRNMFAASAAAAAAASAASASKITYSEAIPRSSSTFSNTVTSRRFSKIRYSKPENATTHNENFKKQEEKKRKRTENSPSTASPVENQFQRFSQNFVSKSPLSNLKADEFYDAYEGSSIGAQSAHPYQLDSVENSNVKDASASDVKQPTSTIILEEHQFTAQNSPSNIVRDTIETRKEIKTDDHSDRPNMVQINREENLQKVDEEAQESPPLSRFVNSHDYKNNDDILAEEQNNQKKRDLKLMKAVIEKEKSNKVLKRKKNFTLTDKHVSGVSVAAKAARGESVSAQDDRNESKLSSSKNVRAPADTNANDGSQANETTPQSCNTEADGSQATADEEQNRLKHKKTGSSGINFFKRFGFGKKGNKTTKEPENPIREKNYSRNLFSRKKHKDLSYNSASDRDHPNGFQQNLNKQNIPNEGDEVNYSISETLRSLKSYPISSSANTNRNTFQNTQSNDTRNQNRRNNEVLPENPVTPTKVVNNEVLKSTSNKDSNGTGSSVVVSSDKELESLIKQNNKLDKKLNTKEDDGRDTSTDSDCNDSGNEMTVKEKL